jgi:glutamyl-tRNA reductase
MMHVLLVGMNHLPSPLELRERLSLSCGGQYDPLGALKDLPAVQEAVYLATCNRVEILASTDDPPGAREAIQDLFTRQSGLDREDLCHCLYSRNDGEALGPLFRVASGLDSLIIGEPQILGQVKDAYRPAVEGKKVLLIGAGEMSELAARHLLNQGTGGFKVANRTYSRAAQLASAFNGLPVAFDAIPEALQDVDIVISSTGASGYVLTPEMIAPALKRRRNRLLFLIDIAVPRDIDPRAGDMDNVYLYNMDDLQDIADENLRVRRAEASKAEGIVAEEVKRYLEWFSTLEVVPTIVSLRAKVETIVRDELDRSGNWLRGLSAEDREAAEILIHSIVNKILHDPMTTLKEESRHHGGPAYVAALRRLFRLEDGQGS